MTLQELLEQAPRFHTNAGQPWSWQLATEALEFIDAHVDRDMSTLETGAGVSTVLFAARGAHHTAIAPAPEEFAGIRRFCAQSGVSLDRLTLHAERSEELLPGLALAALDVVLIDGSHAFPAPFIDWYYTAAALKVGGHLIVDDVQLWTGHVLKRFLDEEPGWALRHVYIGRSAVFVKEHAFTGLREWTDQPFVTRRSRPLEVSARARHAVDLIRQGKFRAVLEMARALAD
jgi:hypothetical protein